ncbi:MAG TPA: tripartite tricarboxylate transporter substrate binding protein [Burkholderiales bacterium]|nr:tripartite tricarboxylate transporter substrate binding protein [Burkholderiales bacterium]
MRLLIALALATASVGAAAQAYPSKPVRIIVPFPPGGTADLLSRLTAEKLTASLAQQFVVENRAGAGGNLAAEYVARAEPDGYTLLASPPHLLTINPLLYKLAFDPARFVPISIIATYPNVLLAGPKLRATSITEVIAAARERPGALAIASQGNGTSSHLSAELFKSMAGIDLLHVPYKGTAPAITDLLGGQVELMFDNLITAMPHVKSGKLRLLGVGGEQRVAAFPEVPAITELLPGFRSETWMALAAPPGTPGVIAEKLSAAVGRAVREPDFTRLLTELQAEPVGNTPSAMAEVIRQDTARWTRVIRDARITIQ